MTDGRELHLPIARDDWAVEAGRQRCRQKLHLPIARDDWAVEVERRRCGQELSEALAVLSHGALRDGTFKPSDIDSAKRVLSAFEERIRKANVVTEYGIGSDELACRLAQLVPGVLWFYPLQQRYVMCLDVDGVKWMYRA